MYSTARAQGDTPAGLESDGVLLSTFLLWLIHAIGPNQIVCIEEPETGVHIAAMRQRYELLKNFVLAGQDGTRPQILVATHSRDFLNAIGSRSAIMDEVRVVEFSHKGGAKIHRLGMWQHISGLLEEMRDQMGDLWWSGRLGPNKQQ
jgi:predicted ATPase